MMTEQERFAAHAEWQAWQDFVAEFRKVFPTEDFNAAKFKPMVVAIENWGRELHRLIEVVPEAEKGGVR